MNTLTFSEKARTFKRKALIFKLLKIPCLLISSVFSFEAILYFSVIIFGEPISSDIAFLDELKFNFKLFLFAILFVFIAFIFYLFFSYFLSIEKSFLEKANKENARVKKDLFNKGYHRGIQAEKKRRLPEEL